MNTTTRKSCNGGFLFGALILLSLSVSPAAADGVQGAAAQLADGSPHVAMAVGAADASEHVSTVVEQAKRTASGDQRPLLDDSVVVERTRWDSGVLVVELWMSEAAADRRVDPTDFESFEAALAAPFLADDTFAGVRTRVRVGDEAAYQSVARILPQVDVAEGTDPAEVLPPADDRDGRGVDDAQRGPVMQAGRQPSGALSGVTVFTSAGHGWTGGSSNWYLQRPVLLGMVEDYGNIDQLNYFVHYAFNAGATVVPFRPVGWQPIEIVLDNDDTGVTFTGAWSNGSSAKYYEDGDNVSGVVYRWIFAETTETATARYTPQIPQSDFYPVYCFTIHSGNRTVQTYRIGHSGGVTEVSIDHRNVGNGWIWLGDYYLEAGGDNYVEITNESDTSGAIIADAIRWGCGVGDTPRTNQWTVSGYPRDEEQSRYWAQSQLGDRAVGFDDGIWDLSGYDDGSDNVGTAGRWAREMNRVPDGGIYDERWKRIYLEFHTNASGGGARGQVCLITTSGATAYQTEFANILSDEFDADMLVLDGEFEHNWVDRWSPTYTSAYGAISTNANSDEFDATIVELAFHDNEQDAQLLRDPRVRSAMGRACVHGIIRFLNTLPGSEVPLAFAPDTPQSLHAEDLGGGDVRLSWSAPIADGARGDAATGYVVYQSSNGYGFGEPIELGNVLSTVISDVPAGETRYFRVAATNAGGESMPSEVLAVRRPSSGSADVLIVNGFDRLQRQINPIQTFSQPPNYAGDSIERQTWRRSNSFDYVVQHAEALAAADAGFASTSNEAVIDGQIDLADYAAVVWILGTESSQDQTFSPVERSEVTAYLDGGGALFVSGSELAYELIGLSVAPTFMEGTLQAGYGGDDAQTFLATGAAGSILSDISTFDFDIDNGAAYEVRSPDMLLETADSMACLNYVGGSGGIAGVQYTGPVYNTVIFGFPFEAISDAGDRAAIMQRVLDYLYTAAGPLKFDYNSDGAVNMSDFNVMRVCWYGPGSVYYEGHFCLTMDGDDDLDVDFADFWEFQQYFTGP